jgi:23S rRNA (cytosine1962-C5)-methyltransferase
VRVDLSVKTPTTANDKHKTMQLFTPVHFPDYQLLDCGDFEKLEKFGDFILARPEPQALWHKSLPETTWQQAAATFCKDPVNPEKGIWETRKDMPDKWKMHYGLGDKTLIFKVSLSAFKHVGVFPEQAVNWGFIFEKTSQLAHNQPRVLNLFAYTGIASLAAAAAGAEVVHVDAVKQVISWANENRELSGLDKIRWVAEDALKFVNREVRRGNRYAGIILDPPAYGRGPEGEKWLLENHLPELLELCGKLLAEKHFFILSLYSLGYSALMAENLIQTIFPRAQNIEAGEVYVPDEAGKKLPLGVICRFHNL